MPYHAVKATIAGLVVSTGCNSPETKECHERMATAQTIVNAVESNSIDSVNRCIGAIQSAEAACKRAGRDSEVKELTQAKERFEGHRVLLEERNERKQQRESISPAQLEKLLRDGDPSCPRGQGYLNKASNKEIRCTGVQPAEMNWSQAKKYFGTHNFRSVMTGEESILTLESGAERYVFHYTEKDSPNPARCIVIYSKPGISWQEAVARNTGVPPERLKDGGTITLAQGRLQLSVDDKNQVARIGDCPK
jgi:hypothetical protein